MPENNNNILGFLENESTQFLIDEGKKYLHHEFSTKEINNENDNLPSYLRFTALDEISTISLNNIGNAPILYYSYDNINWSQWDYNTISLQPGESIYMYGDNPDGFSTSNSEYSQFVMSGKISASGNIQSLLSKDMPDIVPNSYCYYNMFSGCTSLATAPELPATTLTNYCYYSMFRICTSLVIAPELPATTLTDSCYSSMFYGCSNLVTAPSLPATILASNCYSQMFSGCTSLITAPELPATTLTNNCYFYMFRNCSSLKRIEVGFTSWTPSSATNYWVYGVPQTIDGIFVKPIELPEQRGDNYIPTNWQVENNFKPLCFTSLENICNISLQNYGENEPKLYYTTDITKPYNEWTQWDYSQIELQPGESVWMYGDNSDGFNIESEVYSYFTCNSDGSLKISGDIQSLISVNCSRKLNQYCFYKIFKNLPVVDASELLLPATTLTQSCYKEMFSNCTSLVNVPALPATTLANHCYENMFRECTSLVTAPELPATTLSDYCYKNLFLGCSSLVTAPALPATTLAYGCYQNMFRNCTSLVTAPELPATILATSCYSNMFYGCSSLVTAPELPAIELNTYCYEGLFSECINLKSITIMGTSQKGNAFDGWVINTSSKGVIYNLGGIKFPTIKGSGVPSGWIESTRADLKTKQLYEKEIPFYPLTNIKSIINDDGKNLDEIISTLTHFNRNNYLCFTSLNEISTLTLLNEGDNSPILYYSDNGVIWKQWDYSEITIQPMESVWMYGVNPNGFNYSDDERSYFQMSGKISVSGNIQSLLSKSMPDTIPNDYCYSNLFNNCNGLVDASDLKLPAKVLTNNCYDGMFSGCSNLVTAPELPATTLATECYQYMFSNCTSLTNTPELTATTLANYCYNRMFQSCTNLKKVIIYAKSLGGNSLTNWLNGCSSNGVIYNMSDCYLPHNSNNGVPSGWDEYVMCNRGTLDNIAYQINEINKKLNKVISL